MPDAHRFACPNCHAPVAFANTLVCSTCGPVGRWLPAERRIDWSPPSDDFLSSRVSAEREEWDGWADRAVLDQQQPRSIEWLRSTRTMRAAATAAPAFTDVAGKRLLDIGSTCRHSVKFLKDGAARVDQIEVSPASQAFALRRLAHEGVAADSVYFHTTPAERLPFEDETFDLIFSSGTIHHTWRAASLPEVKRVLKPGGQFLFIESYLPATLQPVMKLWRGAHKADRGTDVPISTTDLTLLRDLFEDVALYPFDVLWLPLSQTLGRTRWGRSKRAAIARIDEQIGDAFGLGSVLGTQCWIAGRKAESSASLRLAA